MTGHGAPHGDKRSGRNQQGKSKGGDMGRQPQPNSTPAAGLGSPSQIPNPRPIGTPAPSTRPAATASSQRGTLGGARGGRAAFNNTAAQSEAVQAAQAAQITKAIEAAQAGKAAKDASPDVTMHNASTSNATRGSHRGRGNYRGSRGGHRNFTQQRKTAYSMAREEVDYVTLIANHFNGTRRGGDIPHTEQSKFKKWATQKRTVFAIPQPSPGANVSSHMYGTPVRLPMTMSYNIFSQNPSINIHVSEDQDAAYFPINIEMMDIAPVDGKKIIERVQISDKELEHATVNAKIREIGCTADLYMVQEMIKMGKKAKEERSKGLNLMSIALPADAKLWLKRCSSMAPADSNKFLREVNASRRLLIIRENWFPQTHLDAYFDSRASACVNGIYPFYQPMIKSTVGSQFKDFIGKDAMGKLDHMPWMGNPLNQNAYSDFPPLGWFTSFKEYETVLSAEVIHGRDTEKEVFNRIFSPTQQHEIRAISRHGTNHWLFHVTMNKGDEKNVPSISPGTFLTMKQVHVPAEFKIVPAKHKADSILQIDNSTPSTVFPEHKGKVIDVPTNFDFVFSCIISDNSIDQFVNLADRKAVFSIELNRVPSDRQLEAIAGLATLDEESNLGKLLLAKAFTNLKEQPSLLESHWDHIPPVTQSALNNYELASECNVEQQKAVDLTFRGKHGITLVQGPPGTGKSTTVAYVAVKAAGMGVKVSVTAPANVPTRSLAANVVMEAHHYHQHLGAAQGLADNQLAADSFKIVFVPTRAQTGRELFDLLSYDAEESLEDDDLLKKYTLAAHLIELAKKKAANGDIEAKVWLEVRRKLANKEALSPSDKAAWRKVGLDWAPLVFKDPAVKIVISTCNNHANEMLAGWEADVNIIDEAAFATEPDVLVPLNKAKNSAKMIVLVGDHMQLTPVIPSIGMQVWGRQGKLSMFKRILDELAQVPFVMLKENYRMHPEISEFPALGYKGLLCNPLTRDEEAPMWKAWKSFMESCKMENTRRKDPVFFDKENFSAPSFRRMFINTGGKSGPKPGGNSLQNFANINWIVDTLISFTTHMEKNNFEFEENGLIIQVPYVAEKNELLRQIYLRCSNKVAKWVIVKTIDSNQGVQSPLSWLSLTAANPHHGSKIGFMDDWNWVTVALTRGKASLCCFGNIDSWLPELEIFWAKEKLKNWALFMTDLLVKGSVFDTAKLANASVHEKYINLLPAHAGDVTRRRWTKSQPKAPEVQLTTDLANIMRNSTDETLLKAKKEAIARLSELKEEANKALNEIRQARVPSSHMETS